MVFPPVLENIKKPLKARTQLFAVNKTGKILLLVTVVFTIGLWATRVDYWFYLFNGVLLVASWLYVKNQQLQSAFDGKEKTEAKLKSKNEKLKKRNEQLNWIVVQKTTELQVYLEAINVGIYSAIIDLNGNFIKTNEPLQRAVGYSGDELIGINMGILNDGTLTADFFSSISKVLTDGKSWRGEVMCIARDGSVFWADQVITPVKNKLGSINYYFMLGLPITERKINEEARERTLNFLETIAHQTSHKVRGPIARIQGLVNLIQNGMVEGEEFGLVTEKLKESSLEVNQATAELVNLVNNSRHSVSLR